MDEMAYIRIVPLGVTARWLDKKFEPLMRQLSGAPDEAPQRTHRWNNHHLTARELANLDTALMVHHESDPNALPLPPIGPLGGVWRHVTGLSRWRHYLVVQPIEARLINWHIGWYWNTDTQVGGGISRIPINGMARVTVGDGKCSWFATDCLGYQVPLQLIAEGEIGDSGIHTQVPLF